MKTLITATAILMLFASAASAQDRTQEYRMWSAEQMIHRIADKSVRTLAQCNRAQVRAYMPTLSEACEKSVLGAYPVLNTIREVAAGSDDVAWAKIIDLVHTLEAGIEGPLNHLEQR